jgi:hypothetical protein
MLCLLAATRFEVEQSQQTQHAHNTPTVVCAVPPKNEQVVFET